MDCAKKLDFKYEEKLLEHFEYDHLVYILKSFFLPCGKWIESTLRLGIRRPVSRNDSKQVMVVVEM